MTEQKLQNASTKSNSIILFDEIDRLLDGYLTRSEILSPNGATGLGVQNEIKADP
jgi:hypothetical protein